MDILESMATEPPYGFPECEAVELDTIDRRYLTEEGRDWMGIWERIGVPMPKGRVVMDWYVWRGYVPFRREERYKQVLLDGSRFSLWGVVMRKFVGGGKGRGKEGEVVGQGVDGGGS